MNRFFDIDGDCSIQLAPWVTSRMQWNGEDVPKDKALFRLVIPLRFQSDIAKGAILVPCGFVSDLASIPEEAWSAFMAPDDPRIALASWIHDLCYQNKGKITLEDMTKITLTREEADQILCFEAMPELGASQFDQDAVYEVLRCFGERW